MWKDTMTSAAPVRPAPLSPARSRKVPGADPHAERGFNRTALTISVPRFSDAADDGQTPTSGKKPSLTQTKYGRPRINSKHDLMEYTFGVPDSPLPGGIPLTPPAPGRSRLKKKFSSSLGTDNESLGDASKSPQTPMSRALNKQKYAPFPDSKDLLTRHQVCNDSLVPWTYLLTIPGKNVRDMLIASFNKWIGCDANQLIVVKQVVAYLHSASLIVDDIEDDSATRRGCKAAHIKYGIAPSLNAANYVYFLALEKLLTLQSTDAVTAFTNEMCNLHRGQGRDIFWRVNEQIVSEAEYLHMVQDKTGGLFRLAIRVMHAAAPLAQLSKLDCEEDKDSVCDDPRNLNELLQLANDLASFFQIRDDLINLASPIFHKTKGFCEDITEGKLSFIALHSLRALQGTKKYTELVTILKNKSTERAVICRALAIMNETASFEYCLHYLDQLLLRIQHSIAVMGGNPTLSIVVNGLAKDLEDCRDVEAIILQGS